ncbi:MAG: glutamine-hydrolyzing carbamoyl-phosphate synthase small subunit [Thermodesulfovibrionales bacterium]
MKKAILVLQDGVVFEGESFGSEGEAVGEVVFNTSMTGYQEILTDPSYKGQMVTMTYTQMGNYGVNIEDIESMGGPKVEGFIVKEYLDYPSNWRSDSSLNEYLNGYRIVGIQGIDTRALTRHIRNHGAQMGIISSNGTDPESLYGKIRDHEGIGGVDLVKFVSTEKQYKWVDNVWNWEGNEKIKNENEKLTNGLLSVVVYDFGIKLNILRNLADEGFAITVVPARTPAEAVLEMDPDGILLSNGPGDPEAVTYGIENTKKLIGKKPVFGICLGHQIMGLALGGDTYKLKFGHHGGNHPVKDIATGRVEITSQNHNYCVDIKSLGDKVRLTHRNLYDGTEEGMEHVEFPIFSVQHHPEAGPGPNDSSHIFEKFRKMIKKV